MKISAILRDAANNHLWDGREARRIGALYSCHAVHRALDAYPGLRESMDDVFSFLTWMGVDTPKGNLFDEFKTCREQQQVRYAWLMFAADFAEELGN